MASGLAEAEATAGRWISKRQAWNLFRAAKLNEQQMHPAADSHYRQHGITREDHMGTPWSQMTPAQNIAARTRLATGAAARARAEGDEDGARIQDQVVVRVRQQAGQPASGTENR